jgi:hypothetical protein
LYGDNNLCISLSVSQFRFQSCTFRGGVFDPIVLIVSKSFDFESLIALSLIQSKGFLKIR